MKRVNGACSNEMFIKIFLRSGKSEPGKFPQRFLGTDWEILWILSRQKRFCRCLLNSELVGIPHGSE